MGSAPTHLLGTQAVLDRTLGPGAGRGLVSTGCPGRRHGRILRRFSVCQAALEFTHEQESWVLDDQYCCNPKCPCQEAVLSFIRLPEEAGRGPLQPTLSISY